MSDDPLIDGRLLSSLKVVELREELKKRNLTATGTKAILSERLKEALTGDTEDATEEPAATNANEEDIVAQYRAKQQAALEQQKNNAAKIRRESEGTSSPVKTPSPVKSPSKARETDDEDEKKRSDEDARSKADEEEAAAVRLKADKEKEAEEARRQELERKEELNRQKEKEAAQKAEQERKDKAAAEEAAEKERIEKAAEKARLEKAAEQSRIDKEAEEARAEKARLEKEKEDEKARKESEKAAQKAEDDKKAAEDKAKVADSTQNSHKVTEKSEVQAETLEKESPVKEAKENGGKSSEDDVPRVLAKKEEVDEEGVELDYGEEDEEEKEGRAEKTPEVTGKDETMEVVVPTTTRKPSRHASSAIVHIRCLTRPFTNPVLQAEIEKHGKMKKETFWIDNIKSHCLFEMESQEDAAAVCDGMHGITWPPSNPKSLSVHFSTPEELSSYRTTGKGPTDVKAPDHPTAPIQSRSRSERESEKDERPRIVGMDARNSLKVTLERARDDLHKEKDRTARREERKEKEPEREDRKRRAESPPPREAKRRHSEKEEEKAPRKMATDFFQITKATPAIYYKPLTEEEVTKKSSSSARGRSRSRDRR